jgi:MinD-like ATPase involved in chromosome partitioning or flagellar assembly
MATSKGTKKSAKKAGKKAATKIPKRVQPLYGMPVDKAIATGKLADLRKLSTQAKSYVKQLQTALKGLESKIGKQG